MNNIAKTVQKHQHTYPPQVKSETIPHIDGVTYQEVTASDGRTCIVATGNTQAKKELLKGIGFQWNLQKNVVEICRRYVISITS